MSYWRRLQLFLQRIALRFRKAPQLQAEEPKAPEPEPIPEPPSETLRPAEPAPTPTPPEQPRISQGARRRAEKLAEWERKRRQLDVLVTPDAPEHVPPRKLKIKKATTRRKPEPAEPEPPDNYELIMGENDVMYHEREFYGEFRFRDTILEQLDQYWVYLRRMKKHDPQSYGFYKQVGATIVPPFALHQEAGLGPQMTEEEKKHFAEAPIALSPWWKKNRPAFGCFVAGITKKVEEDEKQSRDGKWSRWTPKFYYFTKFKKPPPNFAPRSGGDVYSFTIWWDRPFDPAYNYKKGGVPDEYAIFLDKDTIQVLPMLDTKMVPIPRRDNGLRYFEIPQRAWRLPKHTLAWAKHYRETPEHFIAHIFMDAARTYEWSNYSMARVAVHNGNLTAQFAIDPRRLSYFFQDRDIVYTANGARETVFHSVRAHERVTKNGVTSVKLHFKGAKEFHWAGYRVNITIPQRDHVMLPDVNLGFEDSYWHEKGERFYVQGQLGTVLAKHIEGVPMDKAFAAMKERTVE